MRYHMMRGDSGMLVVIYPDNQSQNMNVVLGTIDFTSPQDLVGTHAIITVPLWQNYKSTRMIDFKIPQKVVDVEVIDRTEETESYFLEFLEANKQYLQGTHIIRIVKVYCVFDEAIANTPKEQLIVEERTAQNYEYDSEKLAS